MRKSPILLIIALLTIGFVGLYSCTKKVSGINNNQVVETPFSLFFSDSAGGLYSSNDGKTIRKTLFKADGYPASAICVDQDNILWCKKNIYVSTNNGVSFNHAYDSMGTLSTFLFEIGGSGPIGPMHFTDCSHTIPLEVNQSMIVNIPSWYTTFCISSSIEPANYTGVIYTIGNGLLGTWWLDRVDSEGNVGNYGFDYAITMTSLTYLPNDVLCGYDGIHNRNFYRTQGSLWKEVTANPDSLFNGGTGVNGRLAGVRLPHNFRYYSAITGAPVPADDTMAFYSYGHYNNRLIAIDIRNCTGNGAYYSDDTGKNWTQYLGLPAKPLLCISSPFEEKCFIGTRGAGLYVLNTNTGTWQQNTNGLATNLIVHNIAFKQNIYKDGSKKKFIFLATNKGIYSSTDMGATGL